MSKYIQVYWNPNIKHRKAVVCLCLSISTENSVMLLKITSTTLQKCAPNPLNNTLVHRWAQVLVHLMHLSLHIYSSCSGKVFLNAHHPHTSSKKPLVTSTRVSISYQCPTSAASSISSSYNFPDNCIITMQQLQYPNILLFSYRLLSK